MSILWGAILWGSSTDTLPAQRDTASQRCFFLAAVPSFHAVQCCLQVTNWRWGLVVLVGMLIGQILVLARLAVDACMLQIRCGW